MKYKMYSIRDVKTGFMTPALETNDAVAIRNFQHAVMNSDSVLFSHAKDFALYSVGSFDSETGTLEPHMPVLIIEAVDCLK
uniref:Nonstructural protein n=2 Tax=unclassified Microvirus TaxID=338099 RepID=A0AAU8B1E1_9VIRU